jgi:hypothetical protein
MHCELAVPGLLAAAADLRLPALELLIARGRHTANESQSLERWLLDSFSLEEGPLCAGALAMLADGTDPAEGFWARADPVHLRLMRDHMAIVPGSAFPLSREEADALCAALNRHFGGRVELHAVQPQRWCIRMSEALELSAVSPLDAAGRDLEPGSPADPLQNEIQMVLHEHPVNEAREARGEPAINSLWLWGSGRAPAAAASPWQSITAEDPSALGLARAAKVRNRALPASAEAWLQRSPEEGRHLVVLDALRAPRSVADDDAFRSRAAALEQDWFAPLLAALRAGRVGMVTIHVPDAASGVSFETIRADLRRFWRRRRPVSSFSQ